MVGVRSVSASLCMSEENHRRVGFGRQECQQAERDHDNANDEGQKITLLASCAGSGIKPEEYV